MAMRKAGKKQTEFCALACSPTRTLTLLKEAEGESRKFTVHENSHVVLHLENARKVLEKTKKKTEG